MVVRNLSGIGVRKEQDRSRCHCFLHIERKRESVANDRNLLISNAWLIVSHSKIESHSNTNSYH
uniref:Uncharacterized protein n=1 Tax=Candidatus Kentrum sp. MB TaxID=2138164 RepID=A0A451BDD7_9GAMM|nr:MAG: hypothetical protein BECKMB1821G_GA0114241_10497 [Candidatus Kentron sp. MB]VFK33674.1 MAG: hypothetical protein BECKMB1821I_GA0114274_10517 [Candidatus Kentron sp. MB]VFK76292.1 MAG: hypothetical protein BECKMB1821H_GA0114242_10507 [Candidatus Kentron sp. MB]